MDKIDFVLTWVDGSDPNWLQEKNKYEKTELKEDPAGLSINSKGRYRENGFLRYWFRSVEKFAPWVNQIHFITYKQKPDWLNVTHPKLHWVDHRDYIPPQYLPTFNSNVIELNLHRIETLSEHFVLFNDDTFLLQPLNPEFFFIDNLPVLDARLRTQLAEISYNNWCRIMFNNYSIVNENFNMKKSIWQNRSKWFNPKELGFKIVRQNLLCFFANHALPMSTYGHIPLPHLKSTLQEIWDRIPDILDQTSSYKFRTDDQINQWLLCTWNQAKGQFHPTLSTKKGIVKPIYPDNIPYIYEILKEGDPPMICLNDAQMTDSEYEETKKRIIDIWESILPSKSSFEND